jgi:hypothetical protein
VWWLFIRPLAILLAATIPNYRSELCKRYYMGTFLMCIMWIGATSYLLAWMITIIGMQENKIQVYMPKVHHDMKTVSHCFYASLI